VTDLLVTDEPEAVELVKGEFSRVDAVAGPAHGLPFIVVKALENDRNAQLAAAAAYDDVVKAKYTAEQLKSMLDKGEAVENEAGEPAYPIADADDLGKAIKAVGRGSGDHDRIRKYIIGRAKALDASDEIPDDWQADGSIKDAVEKGAGAGLAELRALAERYAWTPADIAKALTDDADAPIPATPADWQQTVEALGAGSSQWEAADAANLRAATVLLVQLKARLCAAKDREQAEYDAGDYDEIRDVFDLEDALCSLDWLLGTVAKLAVLEQAEADAGEADDVAKALGAVTAQQTPADIVKSVGQIAHLLTAGVRALTIKETTMSETDTAVAKAATSPEQTTTETAPEATVVEKAGGEQAPTADDTASAIAKALTDPKFTDVLKSMVGDVVKEAVAPVTKGLDELTGRVKAVEEQPMPGGPVLKQNGGLLLAVRDEDTAANAQVTELQKQLDDEADPVRKAQLGQELAIAQARGLYVR
jgi:hypothetical protein